VNLRPDYPSWHGFWRFLCVGPFYAEQARRQANITTQVHADAVFAAAFLGGVAAAALTPRTVYVVPVRCGRWGCW